MGGRLSTKRVLTNLLDRNILGRRRDSTAITSITTPTCSVRRSRSSWLFVGHSKVASSETKNLTV